MKYFVICIIITCSALLSELSAQSKRDTVWVKGRSVLILGDTSIFIAKDTIFVLPDSVAIFLKEDTVKRSNKFYKDIKKALYRTKVTAELYNLLFDEPAPRNNRAIKKEISEPPNSYEEYLGMVISDIRIAKLAVFGTDINDTSRFKNNSILLRAGNNFHSYTRENIIRNHLFFSEGQILDPVKLYDSERTLRSLPYIKDVRILVDSISSDAVKVVVVVKDNWSLYPGGQVHDFNRFRFSLYEQNFMGLGHQFTNELRYDRYNDPQVGYVGNYSIKNIKNTFITVDLSFAETDEFRRRGIRIYRNFITPDIELSGGAEVSLNGYEIKRLVEDSIVRFDTKYQFQDFWLSRAYPVGAAKKRKRLVTGLRFVKYNYLQQPEVTADSNYQFFSRDQYLFNIGISRREYEKSSLIYGYGRTEDIPIGYTFGLTIGKEYNQFNDRWYAGMHYAIGGYVGRFGYFRPMIAVGSFLNHQSWEQGLVQAQLNYFSYLYQIRRFAFRQFFYINYTEGFKRFGDEYISINDRQGIRGLASVQLRGTKRFVFRSETLTFTPLYLIGFRMAFFLFADIAAIQRDEGSLLDATFYQGYGIGFRFRNENLAIKSFLIRFGFYPNAPDDSIPYDFDLASSGIYRPNDFSINRPQILNFQ